LDGWQGFGFSLADDAIGIDLRGEPTVYVAIIFRSNSFGTARGPFLDDVLITKRVASATVAPTATATQPAGPSATPTATSTGVVTATPTNTGVPPATLTPTSTSPAATSTATATVPATTTSTRTPTATTQVVFGGKGLGVSSGAGNGVTLTWQSGNAQTTYLVYRVANGEGAVLALALPSGTTSYTDLSALPGVNCYAILAQGPTTAAFSDFECAFVGFHSIVGSPQGYTLRLNQTTTANLTWSPPSNAQANGYLVITLGGPAQEVSGSTTSQAVPTNGLTCYIVGALNNGNLIGWTDLLCGLPGFATAPIAP
jgi:hypothetical protein